MIAIGRYFVFILSVAGMILSDGKFTDKEQEDFLEKILVLHNKRRVKHLVKPLIPDNKISELAGDALKNVSTGITDNVPQGYGFNFAFKEINNETKLDDAAAEEIFSTWYNTGVEYNYDIEPTDTEADNFTQIVWANTTHLGLGMVLHDRIGHYAILALYSPSGNKQKEYKKNVLRPRPS